MNLKERLMLAISLDQINDWDRLRAIQEFKKWQRTRLPVRIRKPRSKREAY